MARHSCTRSGSAPASRRHLLGTSFAIGASAAVLLSCIDSRAPAETIMDLRIGDVFNSRVAGNVSNPDILGSTEFACKIARAMYDLETGVIDFLA